MIEKLHGLPEAFADTGMHYNPEHMGNIWSTRSMREIYPFFCPPMGRPGAQCIREDLIRMTWWEEV